MKSTFNIDNDIIIIASHATPDGTELEIGRFDTAEVCAFAGTRERLVQLFLSAAHLLNSCADEYCLYLIGDKTVASNDPNLQIVAKAK